MFIYTLMETFVAVFYKTIWIANALKPNNLQEE